MFIVSPTEIYLQNSKIQNISGKELMKIDLNISAFEFVKIVSQCFQGSNNNSNILFDQKIKMSDRKNKLSIPIRPKYSQLHSIYFTFSKSLRFMEEKVWTYGVLVWIINLLKIVLISFSRRQSFIFGRLVYNTFLSSKLFFFFTYSKMVDDSYHVGKTDDEDYLDKKPVLAFKF